MANGQPEVGRHRLVMDGEWDLLELSGFGRQYVQVYSILYALQFRADQDDPYKKIHAFTVFPWTGGWSAVGFYNSLRTAVPRAHRPYIVSIEYASPGFIELAVIVSVALNIRRIVNHLCSSIDRIGTTYNTLYTAAQKRKLLRIEAKRAQLELDRHELEFAEEVTERLATSMGFDLTQQLRRLTDNPLVRMKILFSLFRRVRDLSKLQDSDQIRF